MAISDLDPYISNALIYLCANTVLFFALISLLYSGKIIEAKAALISAVLWLPVTIMTFFASIRREEEHYPRSSRIPVEFFSTETLEFVSALFLSASVLILTHSGLQQKISSRPLRYLFSTLFAASIGAVFFRIVNPLAVTLFYTASLSALLLFISIPKKYDRRTLPQRPISLGAKMLVLACLIAPLLCGLALTIASSLRIHDHFFSPRIVWMEILDYFHPWNSDLTSLLPLTMVFLVIAWGIFETYLGRWSLVNIWFPILCFIIAFLAILLGRAFPLLDLFGRGESGIYTFLAFLFFPFSLLGILYYVVIRVKLKPLLTCLLCLFIALIWFFHSVFLSLLLLAALLSPYPYFLALILLIRTFSYREDESLGKAAMQRVDAL